MAVEDFDDRGMTRVPRQCRPEARQRANARGMDSGRNASVTPHGLASREGVTP